MPPQPTPPHADELRDLAKHFPVATHRACAKLVGRARAVGLGHGDRCMSAIVLMRRLFQVEFDWSGQALQTSCSCGGRLCVHALFALTSAIVSQQPAAAAAGAEPAGPSTATARRGKPAPRGSRAHAGANATPAVPAARQRLATLAATLPTGARLEPVPVTFEIDVAASMRQRALVFVILTPTAPPTRPKPTRSPAAGSQSAAGSPALARLGADRGLEQFEERTARILALLQVREARQRTRQLPPADQRLPEPWASEFLPLLFRAGSVVLRGTGARAKRLPLQLDVGPAFEFSAAVTQHEGHTILSGRLCRGDEVLAIADARLLLDGWVVTGDRVAPLAVPIDQRRFASELLTNGPVTLPQQPADDDLTHLATIAEHVPALRATCRIADGTPTTTLTIDTRRRFGSAFLAEARHTYGDATVAHEVEGEFLAATTSTGTTIRRNHTAEAAAVAQLQRDGGVHLVPTPMTGTFLVDPRHLEGVARTLRDHGHEVRLDERTLRRYLHTQVRIRTAIDWFDLEGTLRFADGGELTIAAALAAVDRGETIVQLADGGAALLPLEALAPWRRTLLLGERHGEHVRLRRSQALLLDALLAAHGPKIEADEGFVDFRQRLGAVDAIAARDAPAGFVGTLRPYQQMGLGWLHFLRQLGLGGCLADDMGLGKTVQVLALLAEVHADRSGPPTLLVVPLSLLDNWQREAARFTPGLRLLDFHGADRWSRLEERSFDAFDLVVTTYGTLRIDIARLVASGQRFTYAILDEAQAIENEASATNKAVRLLRADHRLALTGTPVMNHIGELWALFEFLTPGLLGRSPAFRALTRDGDLEPRLLQRALAPFLLRRTKAQVLTELPAKQEQEIVCELTGSQLSNYVRLRTHYQNALLGGGATLSPQERFRVLEALLRLRQAACHEALVTEQPTAECGSAKLDALVPMLVELVASGHKALVFSQFTSLLELLKPRLAAAGLRHEYLDGKTRQRQAKVDRFQADPDCPLFLISLKAGGFGLNLTAADYVFLLDPWWNPAAEAQAADRAHRIGQQNRVTVYRLIAKGTVEEKVLELQARKRELVAAVLGDNESLLASLTRDDLAALLG